jgi:hypothetical protein
MGAKRGHDTCRNVTAGSCSLVTRHHPWTEWRGELTRLDGLDMFWHLHWAWFCFPKDHCRRWIVWRCSNAAETICKNSWSTHQRSARLYFEASPGAMVETRQLLRGPFAKSFTPPGASSCSESSGELAAWRFQIYGIQTYPYLPYLRYLPYRNVPNHTQTAKRTQACKAGACHTSLMDSAKEELFGPQRGSNRCPVAADPGVSSFLMPVTSDSVKCGELCCFVNTVVLRYPLRFDWQCFFPSVR